MATAAICATQRTADTTTIAIDRWTAELEETGYCIIPRALEPDYIEALDTELADTFNRTPFCRGGFYGETTKRFGRLLARSDRVAALAQHEVILGVVERILSPWCDTFQLNVAQAIAVHPGAPAQLPHRDQDMWRAPPGEAEYLVNVIWPLNAFRRDNGATLVWPGSHGAAAVQPPPETMPVAAEMAPGSALVFLGSTLHGAGGNSSHNVRRGLVIGYSLGWLKAYENQMLAYPPQVASRFDAELRALVGYRQHRPNLGNFEGQCPSVLLDGYEGGPLAATDALRPDQAAMLDEYVQGQRGRG